MKSFYQISRISTLTLVLAMAGCEQQDAPVSDTVPQPEMPNTIHQIPPNQLKQETAPTMPAPALAPVPTPQVEQPAATTTDKVAESTSGETSHGVEPTPLTPIQPAVTIGNQSDTSDEFTVTDMRASRKSQSKGIDTIIEWKRAAADRGNAEYNVRSWVLADHRSVALDTRIFRCVADDCKVYSADDVEIPAVRNRLDNNTLSFSFNSDVNAANPEKFLPSTGIYNYQISVAVKVDGSKEGDFRLAYAPFSLTQKAVCEIAYDSKEDRYYVKKDDKPASKNNFLSVAINDMNTALMNGDCIPKAMGKCEITKSTAIVTDHDDVKYNIVVSGSKLSDDVSEASVKELAEHLRRLRVCY